VFWHLKYQNPSILAPWEDPSGGLWPLFSRRRFKTRHTLFSVKMVHNSHQRHTYQTKPTWVPEIGFGFLISALYLFKWLRYFLVQFWPPGRQWRHLQMILSCGGDQYSHLDTLNIKIRPLFQILLTEQDVTRCLVPILATKEVLTPFACWANWYGHINPSNSKICPLVMIL